VRFFLEQSVLTHSNCVVKKVSCHPYYIVVAKRLIVFIFMRTLKTELFDIAYSQREHSS